jgi:hypothetical protein
MEVSAMKNVSNHKTQMLFNESCGFKVRENTHKPVSDLNSWRFVMAENESEAAPTEKPVKTSADSVLTFIKEYLRSDEALSLMFASMVHNLRVIDNQRHIKINLDQMVWSLSDLGLPQMAESEYRLLFNHFDRKDEGKIDWN